MLHSACLPGDDTRLLLVVDQLEELFTLVDDRDIQRRFLDGLLVVVDDPHERVTVVVTLRADFYDRPLLHPAFGARLGEALVNVTPLSAHELEEAASVPAAMTGVSFEPSLLGRLIGDVVDHPGALPMFQYTLTELFERRAGDVLSEASYDEIGGVRGAITHRAEELFGELGPEEQEAARQLFLRLVSMSGEDTWSRRRVRAEEIVSLDVDVVALQAVIDRFGSRRLLFFDRDRATGAPTVEVGHEALLTEWERLGDWIREARTDLVRHASFVSAVDDWERSDRDPGYLVTGARLAEYEKWAGASRLDLNARELQFLGASLQAREREVRADQERTEREVRLDRRARRRLWAAVAAVIILVVLVGGLVVATVLNDTTRVAVVTSSQEDALGKLLIRGVEQAAADLPVEIMDVIPPITDLSREYRRLAAAGVELIIVPAGLDLGELYDIAADMPDVTFVTVMASEATRVVPTSLRVEFAEEQAGFLAGVAAAAETKTGVVGFVGGAAVLDVEMRRAGFEAGVAFVDPSVTVLARHVDANGDMDRAFLRADLGKAAAEDLFDRGADVVYHTAGRSGLGVFQAAREHTEATFSDQALGDRLGLGSDLGGRRARARLRAVVRASQVRRGCQQYGPRFLERRPRRRDRALHASPTAVWATRHGGIISPSSAVSRVAQAEATIIDGTVEIPLVSGGRRPAAAGGVRARRNSRGQVRRISVQPPLRRSQRRQLRDSRFASSWSMTARSCPGRGVCG